MTYFFSDTIKKCEERRQESVLTNIGNNDILCHMENIGIKIIDFDRDYARALSKSISCLYPGFSISLCIIPKQKPAPKESHQNNNLGMNFDIDNGANLGTNFDIDNGANLGMNFDNNLGRNFSLNFDNNPSANLGMSFDNNKANSPIEEEPLIEINEIHPTDYYEECKSFDICLISSMIGDSILEEVKDFKEKILVLFDSHEEHPPKVNYHIDKYSPCDLIVRSILHRYAESSNRPAIINQITEDNSEVISFFSTEGGAGTTSVALGVAREMAMFRGKQVLFLSREPFETVSLCDATFPYSYTKPSIENQNNNPGEYVKKYGSENSTSNNELRIHELGGSAEYLYFFLKGEKDKLSKVRDAVIIQDDYGVMRFVPSSKKNRLCELDEVEFSGFVSHLSKMTAAETVIIDRGVWLGDYLPGQRLILVTKSNSVKSKPAHEIDMNMFGVTSEQLEQMIIVENTPIRSGKERSVFDDVAALKQNSFSGNSIVRISWDGSDFKRKGQKTEINLTNIFGNSIKELCDILLNQNEKKIGVEHYSDIELRLKNDY